MQQRVKTMTGCFERSSKSKLFVILGILFWAGCNAEKPTLEAGWHQSTAPIPLKDLPASIANNPALEAIQVGSGPLSTTWNIDHSQSGPLNEIITQKQKENLTNMRAVMAGSDDPLKEQLLAELDRSLATLVEKGLEVRGVYFSNAVQSDLFQPIANQSVTAMAQAKSALISDGGQEIVQSGSQKGQRKDWHPSEGSIQIRPEGVFHKFQFTNRTLEKYRTSDYGWELQADITLPVSYASLHINSPLDIFGWGCYEIKRKNGTVDGQTTNIPTEAAYYIDSPFADNVSKVNQPVAGCFAGEKYVQSVGLGARYPGKLTADKTYYMWLPGKWKTDLLECSVANQTESVIVSSSATVQARNQGNHSLGEKFLCSCKDGYQNCMFKAGCDSTGANYCDANESGCPNNDETNDVNRMVCYNLADAGLGNSYGVVNYEVPWHINFCALPNMDKWSGRNRPCCSNAECKSGEYCDYDALSAGGYCRPNPTSSCIDKMENGNETDVDCGGGCGKCSDGKKCKSSIDCQSNFCSAGRCAPPAGPLGPCSGGPVPTVSWRSLSPLDDGSVPTKVSAVLGDQIHVFGGMYAFAHRVYDIPSNTWTAKMLSSASILNGAAAAVSGVIYGFSDSMPPGNVIRWNASVDTWTSRGPVLDLRNWPATAVIGNLVYLAGGTNGYGEKLTVYDPNADTWVERASLSAATQQTAAAAYNGNLYVFGGGPNPRLAKMYNPSTNVWMDLPPLPVPRLDANAIAVGSSIWVIGGGDYTDGSGGAPQGSISLFDLTSNKWCAGPTLAQPLMRFVTAYVNGKIYIIGGFYSGGLGTPSVWEGTVK